MIAKVKLSLLESQKYSYWNSNSRINIWEGPVRSGKTVGSIFRWISYIGNAPPGDLIMVGKTDGSLYRNIIRPMQEYLGHEMRFYPGKKVIELWGRVIFTFGANDERAEGKIRGMTCAGAYGDEITLWPKSFFNMMLSRMSVDGASFFGSTNPDCPRHWLKTDYIDRKDILDMSVFKFMLEDNIFLPPSFVDNLKKEYQGLWYRRFILGEWCQAEGAIFDFFINGPPYVVKETPEPSYYISALDYGTQNPFWCGLFGVNPFTKPKIWLEKEYVYCGRERGIQKTDAEYSKDLKDFYGDIQPINIYPDPSAASFIAQLKKDNFIGVKEADNSVLDGIRTVSKMMKNGDYVIKEGNDFAIEENEGYEWDDKAQEKGEDKPLKQKDHACDGQRYGLHTHFGVSSYDMSLLVKD